MLRKIVCYLLLTILLMMGLAVAGSAAESSEVKKALLVIDIQDAYIYNYKTADTFIATVNKVIEKAAKQNIIPVYILQDKGGKIDEPAIKGAIVTNFREEERMFNWYKDSGIMVITSDKL